MIPKKIYLNPKTLDALSTTSEGVRTMSVRSFPGKTDAEYTDLQQAWHEASEIPGTDNVPLLAECRNTRNHCPWRVFSVNYQLNWWDLAEIWHIVRWAYIPDLTPRGTGHPG